MANQSITALVSAFARAYHASEDGEHVFVDSLARVILGETDYAHMTAEWSAGAAVFAPDFGGDSASALRCVVNRILAGAPLARAAFSLGELRCAAAEGAEQYLIFGAGYDSFAYCRPEWAGRLSVWEIDQPDTAADKQERLRSAGIAPSAQTHYLHADLTANWAEQLSVQPEFDRQADSFCSLLGLSYYLTESEFAALLTDLRKLLPNCRIAFDFPLSADGTDSVSALAAAAGECMQAQYTPESMERLLQDCGWRANALLSPEEIEQRYFTAYNAAHPQTPIQLAQRISLCCAETER